MSLERAARWLARQVAVERLSLALRVQLLHPTSGMCQRFLERAARWLARVSAVATTERSLQK